MIHVSVCVYVVCVDTHSNYSDPFGHWEAETAECAVLSSCIRQQTNGCEKAYPIEEEGYHERTQEHALAADVLIVVQRIGRLVDSSQLFRTKKQKKTKTKPQIRLFRISILIN